MLPALPWLQMSRHVIVHTTVRVTRPVECMYDLPENFSVHVSGWTTDQKRVYWTN